MSNADLHIDFSQVREIEPVPTGTYEATIVNATPGISKASQSPKLDCRWRIDDGEYAGRQVFDTMSFHPNALWRTKQTLRAIDPLQYPDDFAGAVDPEDLIGQSATIVVTLEKGRGNDPQTGEPYPDRSRVKSVLPYGTEPNTPRAQVERAL